MTAETAPDSTFASPPSTATAPHTRSRSRSREDSDDAASPWMGGPYHLQGGDVETPEMKKSETAKADDGASSTPYTDILKLGRGDLKDTSPPSKAAAASAGDSIIGLQTPATKMHVARSSVGVAVPDSATKQLFITSTPPPSPNPSGEKEDVHNKSHVTSNMSATNSRTDDRGPAINKPPSKSQKRKARKQMPNLLTHGYFPSTTRTYNPFVSVSQHENLDLRRLPMDYRPNSDTSALMVGASAFSVAPSSQSPSSSAASTPARAAGTGEYGRTVMNVSTPTSSDSRRQRARRKKRKLYDGEEDDDSASR